LGQQGRGLRKAVAGFWEQADPKARKEGKSELEEVHRQQEGRQ